MVNTQAYEGALYLSHFINANNADLTTFLRFNFHQCIWVLDKTDPM